MSDDGSSGIFDLAGAELPDGGIGAICFQGPQTFLGYVGNPEATARAVPRDGVLYTGDEEVGRLRAEGGWDRA